MKRLSTLVTVILGTMFLMGCGQTTDDKTNSNYFISKQNQSHLSKETIFSVWKITRLKRDKFSGMSESESKSLLGNKIIINSNKAVATSGKECEKPSYEYVIENDVNGYLYDFYKTNKDDLSVESDVIHKISVHCGGDPFFTVNYLENEQKIMTNYNGVFYFSVKKEPWYSWIYF